MNLNSKSEKVNSLPIQTVDTSSNNPTTGASVDTHLTDGTNFENALVFMEVGAISASPGTVTVTIQESDDESSWTDIESFDVTENHSYTREIERKKRYLRIKIWSDGGDDTIEFYGGFILWSIDDANLLSANDIDES